MAQINDALGRLREEIAKFELKPSFKTMPTASSIAEYKRIRYLIWFKSIELRKTKV